MSRSVHAEWELVYRDDSIRRSVRRMAVPGGWLYQVETPAPAGVIWHPPVFVPEEWRTR